MSTDRKPRAATPRQLQVLRFLIDYEREHTTPPTLAEILGELGVDPTHKGAAQSHLRALKLQGLALAPAVAGAARGWRASPAGRELLGATRRCPHCRGVLP